MNKSKNIEKEIEKLSNSIDSNHILNDTDIVKGEINDDVEEEEKEEDACIIC